MKQKNKIPSPAAKILDKLISERKRGVFEIRPRDINSKEKLMNDKIWKDGIDWLIKFNFVKKRIVKKNEVYYLLRSKYLLEAFKIGRQNSDIMELQSFPFNDIINLTSTKGKTTIYGLPEEVFNKSDFKNRTFDYSQRETLDFKTGIKTTGVCGKNFGVPLGVKIKLGPNSDENKIVDMQVKYYLDLIKKKVAPEDIIRRIITTHRNSKIQFNKLGENISHSLIELKREYRKKRIREIYKRELKVVKNSRLKSNLSRLKEGFIGILAHTDHDKYFLKRAVFEFCGDGVGGYSCNKNIKLFWSFHKFINSLTSPEKKVLFNFLWGIFEENRYLYPTNVAFICKGHSVDYLPEGIEKII